MRYFTFSIIFICFAIQSLTAQQNIETELNVGETVEFAEDKNYKNSYTDVSSWSDFRRALRAEFKERKLEKQDKEMIKKERIAEQKQRNDEREKERKMLENEQKAKLKTIAKEREIFKKDKELEKSEIVKTDQRKAKIRRKKEALRKKFKAKAQKKFMKLHG